MRERICVRGRCNLGPRALFFISNVAFNAKSTILFSRIGYLQINRKAVSFLNLIIIHAARSSGEKHE